MNQLSNLEKELFAAQVEPRPAKKYPEQTLPPQSELPAEEIGNS